MQPSDSDVLDITHSLLGVKRVNAHETWFEQNRYRCERAYTTLRSTAGRAARQRPKSLPLEFANLNWSIAHADSCQLVYVNEPLIDSKYIRWARMRPHTSTFFAGTYRARAKRFCSFSCNIEAHRTTEKVYVKEYMIDLEEGEPLVSVSTNIANPSGSLTAMWITTTYRHSADNELAEPVSKGNDRLLELILPEAAYKRLLTAVNVELGMIKKDPRS